MRSLLQTEINFQKIKFEYVFTVSNPTSNVGVNQLDVKNQVVKCCQKFKAFKVRNTVYVIYLKRENCNAAINNDFNDLKARSKVRTYEAFEG